jgi:hypothetical protein
VLHTWARSRPSHESKLLAGILAAQQVFNPETSLSYIRRKAVPAKLVSAL